MSGNQHLRCLPLALWPELDRQLWEAALGGAHAATFESSTLRALRLGYGRWLSELAAQGCLADETSPADRVTPSTVRAYADRLHARGNTKATIDGRFGQLLTVLRILAPQRNFNWLHPSRQANAGAGRPRRGKSIEERVGSWPAIDQQLWQAGFEVGDVLAEPRHGLQLRPSTIGTIVINYGQWLTFLAGQGLLEPWSMPAARITRAKAVAFIRKLRETHVNASLVTRLSMLRSALRVMQPDIDLRWLTAPGGQSLASAFPGRRKPIQVIGSKVLYQWGQALMQAALTEPNPERRRLDYRDGLLIALFAARAPRVRSMASLRLGSTVLTSGSGHRLLFETDNVKTGCRIEYEAPAGLAESIARYVAVERVELMDGQEQDAFWLDQYGEPLSIERITGMIRARSKVRFGVSFGPHRFRHALGTTAPLIDPAHPGVAAAMLGISSRMVERHYNRARQVDVADRWHASLRQQRRDAQTLAENSFRKYRKPTMTKPG